MIRRLAVLFALLLTLVASTAFPLSNGCNNFECYTDDNDVNQYCVDLLSGGGRLAGCVTVRQCAAGAGCITYCQYTTCSWV